MDLVDDLTLDVRLKILDVAIGESFLELRKKLVEARGAVNRRFAFAKEVKVGTVDDLDLFHVRN